MRIEVAPDAAAAACRAAAFIARRAARALRARGRFALALSGGQTPLPMLQRLATEPIDWSRGELFQVDERSAARDSDARNLGALDRLLVSQVAIPPVQVHPMPVEQPDLSAAAAAYAAALVAALGDPPVLDLVHLGLGRDGHTASLMPGDAATRVTDAWVSATAAHGGWPRVTLTLPAIDAARCVLWLVCGASKAPMLARLARGDRTIPAGLVRRDRACLIADEAAAGLLAQRRGAHQRVPPRSSAR